MSGQTSAWVRFLRRCRSVLWTAVFLVTVGLAVLVGIGRAVTPYAGHLKPWLEQRLAQALKQPVSIARLTAEWQGLNPSLQLNGLTVGGDDNNAEGQDSLTFEQAKIHLYILHWLLPRRDDWSLELTGVDINLLRDEAGRWTVQGLASDEGENTELADLLELGHISIANSRLHFLGLEQTLALNINTIRLRQLKTGLTLDGELGLEQAPPIRIKASLSDKGNATDSMGPSIYLEAQQQPVSAWLNLLASQWANRQDMILPGDLLDAKLWLDWHENKTGSLSAEIMLTGELPLHDQVVAEPAASAVANFELGTQAWLEWQQDEWQLQLGEMYFETGDEVSLLQTITRHNPLRQASTEPWLLIKQQQQLEVTGRALPLPLMPVLMRWLPELPEDWRSYDVSGNIHDFRFVLDEQRHVSEAQLSFNELSLTGRPEAFAISQLGGALEFAQGNGELTLSGGEIRAPKVFPDPLPVEQFDVQFGVEYGVRQLSYSMPSLRWDTGDLTLAASARYVQAQQDQKNTTPANAANEPAAESQSQHPADWLELSISVPVISVAAAKKYLPLGVMGKRTGPWLRRGLLKGEMEDIRAVFQGSPGDWPFSQNEGVFRASAQVKGIDIRFNDAWPIVSNLNGRLSFSPKEMFIDDASVRFAGAPVQSLDAYIADMDAAVLSVDLSSYTGADTHLSMLGQLPLKAGAWVDKTDLSLAGPSRIDADLTVDFRDGQSNTYIEGQATFLDVSANYNDRILLDELQGAFQFSNQGLTPTSLAAKWREQEASLSFGAEPFSVSLAGHFDIDQVLDIAGMDESWQAYLEGRSFWSWHLTPAESASFLQAHSDLLGVTVDFPDPLAKLSFQPAALKVQVPFGDDIPVHIQYQDEVDAMLLLDEESNVTGVNIALLSQCADSTLPACVDAAPAPLPGLGWLQGSGRSADLLEWVDVIESLASDGNGEGNELEWHGATEFASMQLLGRFFTDAQMTFARNEEHWLVGFDGEQLAGKVRLPAADDASNTIVAEFDYLHLPKPPDSTLGSGFTDPTGMPALHLYAEDLQWDDWPVGEIQVQAFPVEGGLRFETIEASNSVFTLTGQGEWLRDSAGVISSLSLRVDAEQLGALLDSLGYGAVVEGGQSIISLSGSWPGGPADFALAKLDGELNVSVTQGRFPEAGPGAGRMLGLMSVQALPRRILLDFRDVFETGLNFDRLEGRFNIADGYATTTGLEIDSTAAKIVISGRTDLVNREYDQTVSIRPGVGSTLPVIGAIAGGPVGVTAGLALQGLLNKPLGGLAEVTYHVSGPWDDPQVADAAENENIEQGDNTQTVEPDQMKKAE